jgi:ABC-type glycerol-3-phosphate transport system substrate-binding protein
MNPIRPSDRDLLDEVVERAGTHTPDYADDVLGATRHVRQRPAWTFVSTWSRGGRPAAIRIVLVAALVAALPTALMLAGSVQPQPSTPPEWTAPPSPVPTAPEEPSPTSSPLAAARYDACSAGSDPSMLLTVWDRVTDPEERAVLDTLDAEFEAANPGVDVVRTSLDPSTTTAGLREALESASGPDVVQVPAGVGGFGALASAGVLYPLDEAARRYEWEKRWSSPLLDRWRAADGGGAAQSALYGVSSTASILGLFQNYEMAVNRPAHPGPAVLEDELTDLGAMADAGYVPLLIAGADDGLADLYTLLATAASPPGWSTGLAEAHAGATFDTPAARHAAELLLEIVRLGYLDERFATLSAEAATASFAAGSSELLVATSDRNRELNEQANALGVPAFVVFPAAGSGEPARVVVRLGDPWIVRSSSAAVPCASALVDFLTGGVAGDMLAAHGIVPSHMTYSAPALGSASFQDITGLLRDAIRAGTTTHPLDDAFPGARTTLANGLERLIAGAITTDDFVMEIEAAYRAHVATLR